MSVCPYVRADIRNYESNLHHILYRPTCYLLAVAQSGGVAICYVGLLPVLSYVANDGQESAT